MQISYEISMFYINCFDDRGNKRQINALHRNTYKTRHKSFFQNKTKCFNYYCVKVLNDIFTVKSFDKNNTV